MALIKCPECKKKISDQCDECPRCGYPVKHDSQNNFLDTEILEIVNDETLVETANANTKVIKTKSILLSCGILLFILISFLIILFSLKSNSVEEIRKSVVKINVYDKNGDIIQTGSGFIIFDKNTLITNAHVITNGYTVDAVTESDERIFVDGAVYYSQDEDIVILKINGNTAVNTLDYSLKYKIGDKVVAIGSPLGIKNTVSEGIVSNNFDDGTIQHSAPISSGSSGGALFNSKGEVIGMNTATLTSGQNLNFAIPLLKIKEAYEQSKDNKVKKINKIQSIEYNGIKTVILNNDAGKNLIDIIKDKSNAISYYVTESNNSSYIDTYFLTEIIDSGIASNWIEIYTHSGFDDDKTTFYESKIPQVKIIKINDISDDEILNIMAQLQEETDGQYAELIRCPYYEIATLVESNDGKKYINGETTKHYYSQEYINAFKEPILKINNGYIYQIVCSDKKLAKEIEAEIEKLP